MSTQKKSLFTGIGLITCFLVVLVLLFMPLIDGHNVIEYLDNLYNSISKGSAYYISKVKEEVRGFPNRQISVTVNLDNTDQVAQCRRILEAGGAIVEVDSDSRSGRPPPGAVIRRAGS